VRVNDDTKWTDLESVPFALISKRLAAFFVRAGSPKHLRIWLGTAACEIAQRDAGGEREWSMRLFGREYAAADLALAIQEALIAAVSPLRPSKPS
jgi:hypothetical protein